MVKRYQAVRDYLLGCHLSAKPNVECRKAHIRQQETLSHPVKYKILRDFKLISVSFKGINRLRTRKSHFSGGRVCSLAVNLEFLPSQNNLA